MKKKWHSSMWKRLSRWQIVLGTILQRQQKTKKESRLCFSHQTNKSIIFLKSILLFFRNHDMAIEGNWPRKIQIFYGLFLDIKNIYSSILFELTIFNFLAFRHSFLKSRWLMDFCLILIFFLKNSSDVKLSYL